MLQPEEKHEIAMRNISFYLPAYVLRAGKPCFADVRVLLPCRPRTVRPFWTILSIWI